MIGRFIALGLAGFALVPGSAKDADGNSASPDPKQDASKKVASPRSSLVITEIPRTRFRLVEEPAWFVVSDKSPKSGFYVSVHVRDRSIMHLTVPAKSRYTVMLGEKSKEDHSPVLIIIDPSKSGATGLVDSFTVSEPDILSFTSDEVHQKIEKDLLYGAEAASRIETMIREVDKK